MSQDFRIAFVGSPRSGNVWLHRILMDLLSIPAISLHTPDEVAWNNLPSRCILQLHWKPEIEFRDKLTCHKFNPLVLHRHPLDLLISILHFCRHEPQTACWLAGFGGNENKIINAAPTDNAFVEYACSQRARALLNLSKDWAEQSGTIAVSYEQLVADPKLTIANMIDSLGLVADPSAIQVALDKNSLPVMKQCANLHGWMGRPGLWGQLILAKDAALIQQAHKNLFQVQGYSVEPDSSLTSSKSRKLWESISINSSTKNTNN